MPNKYTVICINTQNVLDFSAQSYEATSIEDCIKQYMADADSGDDDGTDITQALKPIAYCQWAANLCQSALLIQKFE